MTTAPIDFTSHRRAAEFEDLLFLARHGLTPDQALARLGHPTGEGGRVALQKRCSNHGRLDVWSALQANGAFNPDGSPK